MCTKNNNVYLPEIAPTGMLYIGANGLPHNKKLLPQKQKRGSAAVIATQHRTMAILRSIPTRDEDFTFCVYENSNGVQRVLITESRVGGFDAIMRRETYVLQVPKYKFHIDSETAPYPGDRVCGNTVVCADEYEFVADVHESIIASAQRDEIDITFFPVKYVHTLTKLDKWLADIIAQSDPTQLISYIDEDGLTPAIYAGHSENGESTMRKVIDKKVGLVATISSGTNPYTQEQFLKLHYVLIFHGCRRQGLFTMFMTFLIDIARMRKATLYVKATDQTFLRVWFVKRMGLSLCMTKPDWGYMRIPDPIDEQDISTYTEA